VVASWPTPRTITGGAESAERKKELGRKDAGGGDLQAAVKESWPTPNMPSGGPLKDGSAIVGMNGGPGHREVIKKHFGAGAKLNPDWVCTLMGLPVGWVSVNGEGKNRIDELRLLGNGCVPQVVSLAFTILLGKVVLPDENNNT